MTEAPAPSEHARVILPPHIGAVLTEGRNIAYATDVYGRLVQGIEAHSVLRESGRRAWMFENLRVFNSLPDAAGLWKPAVDDYLRDLETARVNAERKLKTESPKERVSRWADVRSGERKIENWEKESGPAREAGALDSEIGETRETMIAMMSVSASARAMERSAGNPENYLRDITQARGPDPDLDAQDYLGSFLLHNDPEKYLKVISDPLVAHYYERILRDAHLNVSSQTAEWRQVRGKWFSSRVVVVEDPEASMSMKDRAGKTVKIPVLKHLRDAGKQNKNSLIYYLCDKAKNGGFDAYIKKVLMRDPHWFKRDHSDTVRFSAARIACDAFLVDKFTRWEYQLTCMGPDGNYKPEGELYRESLYLYPNRDYGGDPLRGVLQPSFVPRIYKGVYSDEAAQILDLSDKAFRPDDIFFKYFEDPTNPIYKKLYEKLVEKILHPSAIENLKKYGRYNKALGLFFGSSRAAGIPEYSMKELGDSLSQIAELLAQVYGSINEPEIDTGKHIVGAMMARMILAKAAAARASMVNPSFFVDIFGPLGDPRVHQPMRELREYLFGPTLDWRRGLIAGLASQRTKFIFQGNHYGAEDDIKAAYKLLATPEESRLRKTIKAGVVISGAMTSKR